MTNDLIDQALLSLDAAPDRDLDDTARRRADARREQILVNDPRLIPPTTTTPRRRPWIAVAAGLTAVGAVVGAVAIAAPVAPTDAAYASWTATPSSVAAAERGLAGHACLESAQYPDAEVVLAERRGDWIAVVAVDDDADGPVDVTCIVGLPAGSTDPFVTSSAAGGQGAVPTGGEFTEGSFSEFSSWTVPGAEASPTASFTVGHVGPDVTALDITGPDGDVVHATVDDGRFVAWWPGRVFETDDGDTTSLVHLTYRITLRDGTVVEDAEPIRPE